MKSAYVDCKIKRRTKTNVAFILALTVNKILPSTSKQRLINHFFPVMVSFILCCSHQLFFFLILFNIQLVSIMVERQQIPELYLCVLQSEQEKGENFFCYFAFFFSNRIHCNKRPSDLAIFFQAEPFRNAEPRWDTRRKPVQVQINHRRCINLSGRTMSEGALFFPRRLSRKVFYTQQFPETVCVPLCGRTEVERLDAVAWKRRVARGESKAFWQLRQQPDTQIHTQRVRAWFSVSLCCKSESEKKINGWSSPLIRSMTRYSAGASGNIPAVINTLPGGELLLLWTVI